jgi:hypothetical protein
MTGQPAGRSVDPGPADSPGRDFVAHDEIPQSHQPGLFDLPGFTHCCTRSPKWGSFDIASHQEVAHHASKRSPARTYILLKQTPMRHPSRPRLQPRLQSCPQQGHFSILHTTRSAAA